MGDVPAVPDYLKALMKQNQSDTASLIASSMSVPRLSFRGKRWRFRESGEEELVKELTVDVIILGVEPSAGLFAKSYYATAYASGDSSPPDCSSLNGIAPDTWVSNPVSPQCKGCPKNVFGSATSAKGKPSKACKDSKILWVAKPGDPKKYYGLQVPVMSLRNMSDYGKYIGQNQFPLSLVITRLGMDDEAEFPIITFEHVGFVQEKDVETVCSMNTGHPWSSVQVPMLEAPDEMPQRSLPQPVENQAPTSAQPTGQVTNVDDVIDKW